MREDYLTENIIRFRKAKGLSQEKVAEYMGVSRQAVTKWENGLSRPSSENLIRLARLLDVSMDVLLADPERQEFLDAASAGAASTERESILTAGPEKPVNVGEVSPGKAPWIFIGISAFCILAYGILGACGKSVFSVGALICVFVLFVPIQLFLHLYFANAIGQDSLIGLAGFDDSIDYDMVEVRKMLAQIDLQIGMMSSMYIFLLCVWNGGNWHLGRIGDWVNGFLIAAFTFHFVALLEGSNFQRIDRLYRREEDKILAKRGMPVTVLYTALLFFGMGMIIVLFHVKNLENNTLPAIKLAGLLIIGVLAATIGCLWEGRRIKMWAPADAEYKFGLGSMVCFLLCVVAYGLMCLV